MYANLIITTAAGHEYFAWKVEVTGDGPAKIYLDDEDDQSDRVAPAGEIELDVPFTIHPDW